MKKTKQPRIDANVEPVAVRRKLAAAYRALAERKKHTPAERKEFARMAEAWVATLPKE